MPRSNVAFLDSVPALPAEGQPRHDQQEAYPGRTRLGVASTSGYYANPVEPAQRASRRVVVDVEWQFDPGGALQPPLREVYAVYPILLDGLGR